MHKKSFIISIALGAVLAGSLPASARKSDGIWESSQGQNFSQQNQWGGSNQAGMQNSGRTALKPTKGLLPGYLAKDNIQKVNNEIHWYTSLNQAEEAARRQNKMVMWVHMIGQMDGAT